MIRKTFFLLSALFVGLNLFANISIPSVFSDNMVLQRDTPIKIWGWAQIGETVTVSFKGEKKKTRTAQDGRWEVIMSPSKYGGPYQIEIKGSNTIILKDVLVGDVWLCSGQSNMDMGVAGAKDADKELKDIDYPQLRIFSMPKVMRESLQETIEPASWHKCDVNSVASFSAVGFFFGRELTKDLNIPIGIIQSSWSGSKIQPWMSEERLSEFQDYIPALKDLPTKDYALLSAKRDKDYTAWQDTLKHLDHGTIGEWYKFQFDDSKWKSINLPFNWGTAGIEVNGVGWFRKEINLTEKEASSNVLFLLGVIQTGDEFYVNGQKIGECFIQNQKRIYSAPPSLLKTGKNIIAIKNYNEWGAGGFYAPKEDILIRTAMGERSFSENWKFTTGHISINPALAISPNNDPTLLFNAMVNPITRYAIKGFLWYQGEGNADKPKEYSELLPALVRDWRKAWALGDIPFIVVQIPNIEHDGLMPPQKCNWAELREAQNSVYNLPNTGVVTTIDIGNADDIHPLNKQDVAHRSVLWAYKLAYNKDIAASAPYFGSVIFDKSYAIVNLEELGAGLECKDKYGYVKGFAIAGNDKKFYWAKAEIRNDKIIVSSIDVPNPVAIRYCWSYTPDISLYGKNGVPVAPFRTDNW